MNGSPLDRISTAVIESTRTLTGIVERWWFVFLAMATMLYLVVVGQVAAAKPFENDELFTLHMSRLPTMSDVYGALLAGGEQLPPFYYVMTRAALKLGANPHLWLRVPSIVGFWVMSLCVFWFVSKRSTRIMGLVALLLPLSTTAYFYAFEARPYGLVLGFAGVALVCWQTIAERGPGWLTLIGLGVSLAGAVSSHYYAVLVLIPFGCGELVHTLWKRRIQWSVWLALIVSLSPLLLFLPLIERARSYSKAFWTSPSWGDMPAFFFDTMATAVLPVTAILLASALYAVLIALRSAESRERSDGASGLSLSEFAVTAGFLLIPVVAVSAAVFVTGAYTHRYALPAVIGLTILVTVGLQPLLRGRDLVALVAVLVLAAGFARRGGLTRLDSLHRDQNREAVFSLLRSQPETQLPIACSNQHDFMILSEYAPEDIRRRLVYLADPDVSMKRLHHDSLERGMLDLLGPWFKMNVQAYQPFIASGQPFLVFGEHQFAPPAPDPNLTWLIPELVASGRTLRLRSRDADGMLFFVDGTASADTGGTRP